MCGALVAYYRGISWGNEIDIAIKFYPFVRLLHDASLERGLDSPIVLGTNALPAAYDGVVESEGRLLDVEAGGDDEGAADVLWGRTDPLPTR